MLHRPEVTAGRVTLDALRAQDAPALFAYRSQDAVARFQGWRPASVAEAAAFIARDQGSAWAAPDGWTQWGIRHDGLLVGDLGVHWLPEPGPQVELGISLDPTWQGRGLATEALRAALHRLFTSDGVYRAVASTDPENAAVHALLRRVGFRQEAHFRQSLHWRGSWVDDVRFGLLSAEWHQG